MLDVVEMESGRAEDGVNAILRVINEWSIPTESIIGGVFDTTNTNSGGNSGVMVRLEEAMGRRILHLYCRHHVYERCILICIQINNYVRLKHFYILKFNKFDLV